MRPTSATAARRRWPRRKPAPSEFRAPLAGARKRGRRRRRARERGRREGPQINIKEIIMKTVVSALLALGLLAGTVAEANAVVCARGVYHAGCAGPHGAVATTRPWCGLACTATSIATAAGSAADATLSTEKRRRRVGGAPHAPAFSILPSLSDAEKQTSSCQPGDLWLYSFGGCDETEVGPGNFGASSARLCSDMRHVERRPMPVRKRAPRGAQKV